MLKLLKDFWADENGAHLIEYVIGLILAGTAMAVFGYALIGTSRGKSTEVMTDMKNLKPMGGVIDENSSYNYSITNTGATGIPTEVE